MPLLFTTHEAGMDKRVAALFPQDPAPLGYICGIIGPIRLVNNKSPALCQLLTRPRLRSSKRQQCAWSPSLPERLLMTFIQVVTFSVVLGDPEGKALKQKPWWPFEKFIFLFPCSK